MRRSAVMLLLGAVLLAGCVPAQAAHPLGRPPLGSIAVIGDFGSGDDAERSVARLVERAQPVAVVTTGDNVYDSDDYGRIVGREYGRWVARGVFLPALGNHDHAEGLDAFSDYFSYLGGRRAYTRVVASVQFYVLDSEAAVGSASERAAQRSWLAAAVPRSRASWQVVVLHHPPHSSGVRHGSTPELQWPFRNWGVDLVLSGHEHHYERIERDGLAYVVDGSGGKSLYPFGDPIAGSRVRYDDGHGALFLSAGPMVLRGEFWSVDDGLVDRFVIPQGPSAGVQP